MDTSLASGPRTAADALQSLFHGYRGALEMRFWDGSRLRFGSGAPSTALVFRDARALRELMLSRDPIRLAREYFAGRVDVEGSIYEALRIKDYLPGMPVRLRDKLRLAAATLLTPGTARPNSAATVAFHYDVSNAFYRLWLDPEMVYSCAYFRDADESLAQAQQNKLDLVCRKLRLKPGDRLLDIGCGWGALAIRAARHYGARVHGITLSRSQFEHARARVEAEGLDDRIAIELRDYRDVGGRARYDKICSIGMFEHVGLKNLPGYFRRAHELLAPGGLFLNHGITSREGGWKPTMSARFINKFVFPDGELDTVSSIQRRMEAGDFEVLHVEGLRPSYALTLRHWVKNLEARREAAVEEVGEPTYRLWRLYMAACALQFEQGETGVYQILLARNRERAALLPPMAGAP